MALSNIMSGMGGIGQQAADLRDSNTPQQLQQSYQKSAQEGKPDIATLLALNDIMKQVKEKEAEMRLAMQPKEPGTILEQRAKKLKDLTVGQNTSEKAEQVGGIAQLQQQKQQQNMQRMAQGAQMAPQGPQMAPQAPPRMAANGGIIMQGAPNMQRMAGGGIIGFAGPEGSEVTAADKAQFEDDFGPVAEEDMPKVVTQEMINAYRESLPRPIRDRQSDAYIRKILSTPRRSLGEAISSYLPEFDIRSEQLKQKQSRDEGRRYQEDAAADYDRMQRERLMNLPRTEIQQPLPVSTGGLPAVTTGSPLNLPPIVQPQLAAPNTGVGPRVEVPGTGIGGVNVSTTQEPATGGFTANDPKIQGLQNALATEQATFNKGLLAEKAGRVGGATRARDDAADFSNRGGVQEQYAAMLAQRRALAEEQAAGRAASSFLRRTSGMVPMGNPGQSYGASAVRDMDKTDRLARNALTRQEAIRTGGIAADEKIAGKALDVQRTTTASNAQLDAAVTRALQQSMTDRGRKLTADQQRALEAQKASMNSADKRALIKSNENIAQYNAKTREIIQNSVNAVTMASARLTAQANATQNKNKAIADIVKKMADIQAKRPKQIADLAAANAVLTGGMKPKAKAAYLDERIKALDTQMKLAIKPLEVLKARLESGVTRVSNSGTKKFDAKGKQTN